MEREKILLKIKEAELEGKRIVEEAIRKKEEQIAKAKRDAENVLELAESRAKDTYDKRMRVAEEDIAREKRKALQNAAAEVDALKKKAERNRQEVMNYFINQFEAAVNA